MDPVEPVIVTCVPGAPLVGENDVIVAATAKFAALVALPAGVVTPILPVVAPAGTVPRLDALVAAGRLPAQMATDLTDSLHFLMALKLKAGLAECDTGRSFSGGVPTDRLSSLERDLLKDALAVVKRFKALVRHQFHLEA